MKKIILLILSLVILFMGCNNTSEKINSETKLKEQLLKEGFIQKTNRIISVGDEKIIIKEVSFDIGTMTIEYEVPKTLSSLLIKFSPKTKLRKDTGRITGFGQAPVTFPTSSGTNSVSFPHNLELINQKLKMEVFIGGRETNFFVDFPGKKLDSLTEEVYFNKNGIIVNDLKEAKTRVIVGLNYIEVESNDYGRDMIVLDLKKKKVLQRTLGEYSEENTIEDFESMDLPRNKINVKIHPEDKLVLLNY